MCELVGAVTREKPIWNSSSCPTFEKSTNSFESILILVFPPYTSIDWIPNEGTSFKMYMKPDPTCVAFSETRNVPNFPKQFRLTGQNVVNPWNTALKFTKKNSKPCKVSFYLEVVPLNPRTIATANYLGPKSDDGYKLSVGFEFASGYLKAVR